MSHTQLPESVQTLYAELLDQLRAADAESAVSGREGSFVSKVIRERTYWYSQRSEGQSKKQIYLGVETPELLAKIKQARAGAVDRAIDSSRRRELVAMLAAGGMARESAAISTVIRVLGEAGVFRAGGVLVGTQAFICVANLLGVVFDHQTLRTADVDVAHDSSIHLGIEAAQENELLTRLRAEEPRFVAVPGLHVSEASTSFRVRGRDLRVDFLTPEPRGRASSKPIPLRHLGIAAQPLKGLGFLLGHYQDAAFVGGGGVLVNVPAPARLALHKLWVASERPASETTKRRKDLRQAEQLLSVILQDRAGDLSLAWQALSSGMRKGIRTSLSALDQELRQAIEQATRSSR